MKSSQRSRDGQFPFRKVSRDGIARPIVLAKAARAVKISEVFQIV
jgi:hypothetical protein